MRMPSRLNQSALSRFTSFATHWWVVDKLVIRVLTRKILKWGSSNHREAQAPYKALGAIPCFSKRYYQGLT